MVCAGNEDGGGPRVAAAGRRGERGGIGGDTAAGREEEDGADWEGPDGGEAEVETGWS